jgi:hypothetical protein
MYSDASAGSEDFRLELLLTLAVLLVGHLLVLLEVFDYLLPLLRGEQVTSAGA